MCHYHNYTHKIIIVWLKMTLAQLYDYLFTKLLLSQYYFMLRALVTRHIFTQDCCTLRALVYNLDVFRLETHRAAP